jgi:hypothetical protein
MPPSKGALKTEVTTINIRKTRERPSVSNPGGFNIVSHTKTNNVANQVSVGRCLRRIKFILFSASFNV